MSTCCLVFVTIYLFIYFSKDFWFHQSWINTKARVESPVVLLEEIEVNVIQKVVLGFQNSISSLNYFV